MNNIEGTNMKERKLFESKGIPFKTQMIYLVISLILFGCSIAGFIVTASLPERNAFNTGVNSKTEIVDGNVVTMFSSSPGITNKDRKRNYELCIGISAVGAVFLGVMLAGRRIYLRIYDKHIEGYAGFGFFAKRINVPIQDIGELSSNTRGLMPSLAIRTKYGNKVAIIMNAKKVIEAEQMLRYMLNS